MQLKSITFSTIVALILSHWHDDHVNGVPAVISNFSDKIQAFYLPQDQPAANIRANAIYRQIDKLREKRRGKLSVSRLEHRDVDHGRTWGEQSSSLGPVLSVQYPDFTQSIAAQSQQDVNQGSGILL